MNRQIHTAQSCIHTYTLCIMRISYRSSVQSDCKHVRLRVCYTLCRNRMSVYVRRQIYVMHLPRSIHWKAVSTMNSSTIGLVSFKAHTCKYYPLDCVLFGEWASKYMDSRHIRIETFIMHDFVYNKYTCWWPSDGWRVAWYDKQWAESM